MTTTQSHHVTKRRTGVVSNDKTTWCSYQIFEFGFEAKQGQEIFQLSKLSRPPVQPTQPHYSTGTGGSFCCSKAAGACSWPPPSFKCQWLELYFYSPHTLLHGMHGDDFIFTVNSLKTDTQKPDESLLVWLWDTHFGGTLKSQVPGTARQFLLLSIRQVQPHYGAMGHDGCCHRTCTWTTKS